MPWARAWCAWPGSAAGCCTPRRFQATAVARKRRICRRGGRPRRLGRHGLDRMRRQIMRSWEHGKTWETWETGAKPCVWEPLRPSESWENVIDYSAISASGPSLIKEHKTESKTRKQERKALKQAPTCTLRYSHNFFRFNSCRKFLQKKQEPATKTILR